MRTLLFLCVVLVFANPLYCQETVTGAQLIGKLKEIRGAVAAITSADSTVLNKRNKLRLLVNDIIIRLDQFENSFPDQYLASLQILLRTANNIRNMAPAQQRDIMDLLYEDLNLKFKDRANTLGAQVFNDLLPVTVVSKQKGVPVSSLRVRYSALGYDDNPAQPDGSFRILTSPATEKLVPGYYKIWVTHDNDFTVISSWTGEISPEQNNTVELTIP